MAKILDGIDRGRKSAQLMLSASVREIDFAIVLSRVIGSIENDPAQLRNAVYELARIKLQTELSSREAPINVSENDDLALALESAIGRVETVYSKYDHPRVQSLGQLTNRSEVNASEIAIEGREPTHLPSFLTGVAGGWRKAKYSWHWMDVVPLARTAAVAILAVLLCAVLYRQFGFFERQASPPFASVHEIKRPQAKPVIQASADDLQLPITTPRPQSLGFPLPTVYGIYAVSGQQLYELEPLVGRVPDQRVFMSTPIKTPSRIVLPDGRTEFIIYRRDIANNAPDRITARVIAKVQRTMTFTTAGQASTTGVEDLWTIRNVSYDFRVTPLGDSSEMLVVRPEKEEFVFPAGRYALVVKGQAYDFTVAGPITEAAQCLEGIKAENGTFYSECRRADERPITSASRR